MGSLDTTTPTANGTATDESKHYNNYFVPEADLKYVPPYFRDTPETVDEVTCPTKGEWPSWLNGTFMR